MRYVLDNSAADAPVTSQAAAETADTPSGEAAAADGAEEEQQHLDEDDLLQLAQKAEEQYQAEQSELHQQQAETLAAMAQQVTTAEEAAAMLQAEPTATTSTLMEQPATSAGDQLLATADANPAAAASLPMTSEDGQPIDPSSQTLIFQTDDGLILIRQPDGNFQVQSTTGAAINMDTVRALISQLQFT